MSDWAGEAVAQAGLCFVKGADAAKWARDGAVGKGEPARGARRRGLDVGRPGQSELLAQMGRQPAGGEGVAPLWRAYAGADAGEDGLRHGASGGVNGELVVVRGEHVVGVAGEGVPVWRKGLERDAEEGGHALGFLVVDVALWRGEGWKDEVVRVDGGEDEGGVNPEQGGDFVSLVELAGGMGTDIGRKFAHDGGVAAIELPGGGEGLRAGAEEHGVDDAKSRVEAADGVVEEVGMMGEGGGNPGMGELQQSGSACAEKDGGLGVDLPGYGARAEEAVAGVAGKIGQMRKEIFDVLGGDVLERVRGWHET